MPGMNGLQAARAIRPMLPSTSLMLFTLHRNEVTDSDALAAGINAVVSKGAGGRYIIESSARASRCIALIFEQSPSGPVLRAVTRLAKLCQRKAEEFALRDPFAPISRRFRA
jgi:DNA-binding NarL/FixJ family response regulator